MNSYKHKINSKLFAFYVQSKMGGIGFYAITPKLRVKAKELELNGGRAIRIDHEKEWAKYAEGKQKPTRRFVDIIERLIPGAKSIYDHPLWKICTLEPEDAVVCADGFFQNLDQRIVRKIFRKTESQTLVRRRLSSQMLLDFEKRCDMDGLAALCLIVLESKGVGEDKWTILAGEALFRSMVRFPFKAPSYLARVADDLFDLINSKIFIHAFTEKERLATENVDYSKLIELVRLVVHSKEVNILGYRNEDVFDALFRSIIKIPVGIVCFMAPTIELNKNLSDFVDWPKEWKETYLAWIEFDKAQHLTAK